VASSSVTGSADIPPLLLGLPRGRGLRSSVSSGDKSGTTTRASASWNVLKNHFKMFFMLTNESSLCDAEKIRMLKLDATKRDENKTKLQIEYSRPTKFTYG